MIALGPKFKVKNMVRVNWAATFCCHCYPTILFFCNVCNPLSHSHYPVSLFFVQMVLCPVSLLISFLYLVTFRLLLLATHSHPPVATYIGNSSLFYTQCWTYTVVELFSFMIFHEKILLVFLLLGSFPHFRLLSFRC